MFFTNFAVLYQSAWEGSYNAYSHTAIGFGLRNKMLQMVLFAASMYQVIYAPVIVKECGKQILGPWPRIRS